MVFNRSDMLRYVFRTHSSGCAENGLGGDQGQRLEEQSGVCEHKLEKRPLLMPTANDVPEAASSPTLHHTPQMQSGLLGGLPASASHCKGLSAYQMTAP